MSVNRLCTDGKRAAFSGAILSTSTAARLSRNQWGRH